MSKKKKKNNRIEESKLYMRLILIASINFILFSYVLSLCGKDPLENLSKCIVVNIIVVFAVYSVKAFFGKKNEADNEIKRLKMEEECDDRFDSNM